MRSGLMHRVKDATGRPLGLGFIEFSDIPQGTEALGALNGQEIGGTLLKMSIARPLSPETPATIARSISARAAGTRDVELATRP
ncbi:hypothetical protein FIBSPDRAFT_1039918 [Athelia psychrophila]|uniref:RRM domain-containing protein n=1 Tax=Athelia psychrophila TaxID=1759441 RepID=A0A166R5L1_9AGAM|nr:hypothetical protein FIBSPDRAFT_1039918 [Fibularhizoctonia sp. CBS 109695]